MILAFSPRGWEDYQHWATTERAFLKRVNRIINAALRDPVEGLGKPERLHGELAGFWSRRITDEHRLVYEIVDGRYLMVHQARYHY